MLIEFSWNVFVPDRKRANFVGFVIVPMRSDGEVVNIQWKPWDLVDSHVIPLVPMGLRCIL